MGPSAGARRLRRHARFLSPRPTSHRKTTHSGTTSPIIVRARAPRAAGDPLSSRTVHHISRPGHLPCSGFHSKSHTSGHSWDRSSRLLPHGSVPPRSQLVSHQSPSYHSLPATLGGARATTPQTWTRLQSSLRAVFRLRAAFGVSHVSKRHFPKTAHRFCCVYQRPPVELGHESP
jgi:hypothetical protein